MVIRLATTNDGGDGRRQGCRKIRIGGDGSRGGAEVIGIRVLLVELRLLSGFTDGLRHLKTRKLGLIVKGLRNQLVGDLELRGGSLEL